jgi:hypothetical protein
MSSPCEQISSEIGALFSCTVHGEYVRIRTPFLYPDGDVIDLFFRQNDGTMMLTDLGESLRWLRMQTVALRRSPKQKQLISDICDTHRVEFFKGMLITRLERGETLSSALSRLAEACIRVSDLWFTLRTRAVQSITDEVAEFLNERQIEYARRERLIGRSGRFWDVDFHTRTAGKSTLIQVLSTGSRVGAHRVAEYVVASFHDLNHVRVQTTGLTFVSLFDDTMDVWTTEDFNLVESVSEIARWSRPDQFEQQLRAA